MSTTNDDPQKLLEVAVEATVEAGNVLKAGFGTSFSAVKKTGAHDLVTEFDKLVEDLIESRLRRAFPDHSFLGEETGTITSPRETRTRWIIDPIDGTLNFCRSIPYFCVSVAAEQDGELICGIILNPIADELFTAVRGAGAKLNGTELQVSQVDSLAQSVLAIGFPFNTAGNPDHCLSYFASMGAQGAQLLRMGSAALNLAYVSAGRFDGFFETSSYPWDVAAGVVLVREAGGQVTNLNHSSFDLQEHGIIAGGETLVDNIQDLIKSGNPL